MQWPQVQDMSWGSIFLLQESWQVISPLLFLPPQELNTGVFLYPSYVVVVAGNISCKDPREHSHENDSEAISNFNLHFAAKSAPTSILSTPVASPRRSSNVDLFDPSINFPQDFNEILRASPAKTLHSPDRSPFRSPGSHSPYLNPNIQEGSQLHKHSSRVWPENNAHPLPLPPRASSPAQSSAQHQSSIMHHPAESSPSMKGQWQKGKLIGRGSFGSVYHATNLYAVHFFCSWTIICFKVCFFYSYSRAFLFS